MRERTITPGKRKGLAGNRNYNVGTSLKTPFPCTTKTNIARKSSNQHC
ncbi:MAG: hypothetical protein NC206_09770 [Bacteroides sp.]|nr:hypothetical protein [Roseburia sp.]MCM1347357.1 hypothetical protein [Bacteroides sp.]MCM1421394.1 hypothetical protein [Bacteroides sp.]